MFPEILADGLFPLIREIRLKGDECKPSQKMCMPSSLWVSSSTSDVGDNDDEHKPSTSKAMVVAASLAVALVNVRVCRRHRQHYRSGRRVGFRRADCYYWWAIWRDLPSTAAATFLFTVTYFLFFSPIFLAVQIPNTTYTACNLYSLSRQILTYNRVVLFALKDLL